MYKYVVFLPSGTIIVLSDKYIVYCKLFLQRTHWRKILTRIESAPLRCLCNALSHIYIYREYKKKVIEICSALAHSLHNLQKLFFHRRKDQAFSFPLSSFSRNLKKNWTNTNQRKIAGRNRIFPPLSIIRVANKKRKCH